MNDPLDTRHRKQRSRAHAAGKHHLCLPRKCDQAPGAAVTGSVTNTEKVTNPTNYGIQQEAAVTRDSEARKREAQALELSAQGRNLDDIAAALGYADRSGAHRAIQRGLDRQASKSVDQMRAMADTELEEMRLRLHSLMSLPGVNVDQAIKAIDGIRKLQERRSKLHGLDVGSQLGQADSGSGHGNDFTGQKGFRIAIDGAPVRDLLPYESMELNPDPSAGTLAAPLPIIVQSPATLFPATVRLLIAQGALWLDGVFWSVPAELVSDGLIDAMSDADTGPDPAA